MPVAALAAGSSGIAGMRERAMLVGGTLKVESAPGRGTAVTLEIPIGAL
jgi:signal transduction histidine kinase